MAPWRYPVFIVCLVLPVASGCTVARISHPDGTTETQYSIFTPLVLAYSAGQGDMVELRGFGLSAGPETAAAGYYHVELYVADSTCRIVVWPETDSELATLDSFLQHHSDACAPLGE